MQQVWQCDFCSDTDVDAEVIRKHEEVCGWNPANKTCWTCANRTDEGAPISGFWNGCSIEDIYDRIDKFSYIEEVEDGERSCDYWELEND